MDESGCALNTIIKFHTINTTQFSMNYKSIQTVIETHFVCSKNYFE